VGSDLIDLGLSVRTKSGDFAHRPLTGSKGRLDLGEGSRLRQRRPGVYIDQGFRTPKVGNVQMSARVCVAREATVPQGESCVCESARVGGDA
jgi:hypothetical protein